MHRPVSVHFTTALQEARFIERPNRFLVRCELCLPQAESGRRTVDAHLPDPGRLKELLIPGCKIWLRPASSPHRKTKWSAVLVETPDKRRLVSLDATLPNRLIEKAIIAQALEELAGWTLVQSEFSMNRSRWDFLLKSADGEQLCLEVKSVTLVENGTARFPDAVTARGARHVRELMALSQKEGWQSAVLFVVQREDATRIQVAQAIDPHFARVLEQARQAGVRIFGRKCQVTLQKITLSTAIPFVP